jgi:hypothetical protein
VSSARERRARRAAERLGFLLRKSRNGYWRIKGDGVEFPPRTAGYGLSLEQVEEFIEARNRFGGAS